MTLRRILLLAFLTLFARPSFAQSPPAPGPSPARPERKEARALWVVRYALGSPASVHRIVKTAKARKFNVILAQVRGRGDAYYLSGLEPRSEYLDGQPPDFDPLAQLVREAHAQGIQVHAWMNTFFVWSGAALPKSPRHLVNAHPEWLMADREGTVPFTAGADREGAYLDPGHPDARRFVHDVFLDVARRYDVDGIHFDYVRYPGTEYGFSDGDLDRFTSTLGAKFTPEKKAALDAAPARDATPTMYPESWNGWRRDNVSDLVRSVYRDVKRIKPRLAVSAALIPWGVFHSWEETDAYNKVNQNWFAWMKEGILDVAVPMTYHTDTPSFAGWVEAAVKNRHETEVWPGIGAYLITPESTAEKIETARKLGAQGFSLFSYDFISKDGTDDTYLKRVEELALPDPASVPPWKDAPP